MNIIDEIREREQAEKKANDLAIDLVRCLRSVDSDMSINLVEVEEDNHD